MMIIMICHFSIIKPVYLGFVLTLFLSPPPLSAGGTRDNPAPPVRKDRIDIFRIIISSAGEKPLFKTGPDDTEILILSQLFEGLVGINPETLQIEPALAASWEVIDDGKIYRFTLGDKRWSDGSPIKAEEFRSSFVRTLNLGLESPASLYLSRFILNGEAYVQGSLTDDELGIRVLPGNVLELEFTRSYPFALNLLTHYAFFLYPPTFFELKFFDFEALAGIRTSGHYHQGVDEKGKVILLSRDQNPEASGPERILLLEVRTHEDGLKLYLEGKADWLTRGALPLEKLYDLDYRYDFDNSAGFMSYFYILNPSRTPLDDPGLRQLLLTSLDREALIDETLRAAQIPSESLVPPSLYRDHRGPSHPLAGLERSGQLFTADPEWQPLIMIYPTDEGHRILAEALISQWEDRGGIPIEGHALDWLDFYKARENGEYHLALGGWSAEYNDPHDFLSLFLTGERRWGSVYTSPEFDRIILEAESLENGSDRRSLQRKAEMVLIEDSLIIPLFFNSLPQLIDRRKWKAGPLRFPGYYSSLKYLHY
ncbi:peptide ABC transporter substrate-binding protein [Oceanispirochaeta sp.]|jgi:oligopeptide transport system substrate-binding protein|uniref:peptide ABC transporter substrate-binding protein n=1 Tax=Oceanispirochaeta sp. TaxID=2035350 RepID=UPI00260A877A|nr:peptide ABC transporter substrate-binding protein [Oceanispirochaeta sp.]MDA3957796.1 peptide ABC transporter substrate-binding protein [Oceanispirochaeta sp.]